MTSLENLTWETMHPFGWPGPFVWICENEATLDGNFTVEMLEALLAEMRKDSGNYLAR